jgi:hypothetical protein
VRFNATKCRLTLSSSPMKPRFAVEAHLATPLSQEWQDNKQANEDHLQNGTVLSQGTAEVDTASQIGERFSKDMQSSLFWANLWCYFAMLSNYTLRRMEKRQI